jgi:hypothetical protein
VGRELNSGSNRSKNNPHKTKLHTYCCFGLSLYRRFSFAFSLYANSIKISKRIILCMLSVPEIIKAVYRNTQPSIARRHTCYALKSNIH